MGRRRDVKFFRQAFKLVHALPKISHKVFNGSLRHFARSFRRQRARIATKLQNPRINKITFHTFRHWKATMEYAKTKEYFTS